MNETDIQEMRDGFGRRASNNGRISFGIRRTKRLKCLVHWAQDFKRISRHPTIVGATEESFLEALAIAGQRAEVRKEFNNQSDSTSKEALPGPLASESKWIQWESKFVNFLSTIIGMQFIPLSYVIF